MAEGSDARGRRCEEAEVERNGRVEMAEDENSSCMILTLIRHPFGINLAAIASIWLQSSIDPALIEYQSGVDAASMHDRVSIWHKFGIDMGLDRCIVDPFSIRA